MGVARPSLLHPRLWNDFTQLVKTTVNIILSAPSVGWASSRKAVNLGTVSIRTAQEQSSWAEKENTVIASNGLGAQSNLY